ncbi:MAG: MarR family winged helix-turn-helix transcriptional regulator [Alphaproteobacteria bacterium]
MDREQIEALQPLTRAIRRLFHHLANAATALHGDTGLTVGMRAVLESVIEAGPQTVPRMARTRPVTRQHIQGLVNALVEAGHVELVDNPAHRRSRLVSPTARGRQTFADLRQREDLALRMLPLAATPDQLAAAADVLRALVAAFDGPEWRAVLARFAPPMETETDDDE